MKIAFTALVVVLVGLGGCATTKEWEVIHEGRAAFVDGIIVLAYDYSHNFEKLTAQSEEQGFALAVKRCKSRGYDGAEAFGGRSRICARPTYGGCQFWKVQQQYQCLPRPEK